MKLPGRDESRMGDYATCGSCHLAHAARFALAPCLFQRYGADETLQVVRVMAERKNNN